MRKLTLLLCSLCVVHLGAAPGQAQRTSIPADTLAKLDAHAGLTFARYGERELQLDLYRPKETSQPLPAIVCVHGGGWSKG